MATSSEIKEAKEMLERLCQEARNRLIAAGVPQATIHVRDCRAVQGGLHIDVRNYGEVSSSFHIWSPGVSKPPSFYERFFRDICEGIVEAENFMEFLRKIESEVAEMFGLPPDPGYVQ